VQWQSQELSVKDLLASAAHGQLMHNGLRVHTYFWKANPAQKRGQILLCHGWEGYALNFALLIQTARKAGYDVHAFDHLAHGRSDGTQSGLPIALSTLLAVAKHVSQAAGPLDLLVGHSLGGAAASWAVAHGEIQPRKLALIAPFYDTHKLSGQWAKAHLLSEEIRGLLQEGLEVASGKTFADFMPDGLAPHFSKHPVPTLVVHDPADKITAFRHSAALASQAKNVRVHEARQLGHIAVLADAACMEQIIQFAQK
jgi:alpha-beta hydrolase superfamily lysophospholipase